ncbi:hypothetical protein ACJX0J_038631, partial [Zea mays]
APPAGSPSDRSPRPPWQAPWWTAPPATCSSARTGLRTWKSKVYYHSGRLRLNPNLYESGKVCLSLLNTWWGKGCEKWGKSSSTMLQVLVSIQGLVLNDRPYFNEPGYKNSAETTGGERCSLAYNQTAFVRSCKTMLYSLRKPPM